MKLSDNYGRRILTGEAVAQPASRGLLGTGSTFGQPSNEAASGIDSVCPHISGSLPSRL